MMEQNSEGRKTILIVEDEPRTRNGLKKTLESWANGRDRILATDSAGGALELIDGEQVDLIVTDIRMPEMDGLALLKEVRERGQCVTAIILSGYSESDYAQEAIRLGVVNYLVKPVHKTKNDRGGRAGARHAGKPVPSPRPSARAEARNVRTR